MSKDKDLYSCNQGSRDAGSITLFVSAIIIPLLFLSYTFSLDIVRYLTERKNTQDIVDSAVMLGAQSLPYQSQAGSVARNLIEAKLGVQGTQLVITTTSDSLRVDIDGVTGLSFASYFRLGSGLPYKTSAQARVSPIDVMIMVDSSSYMAPRLGSVWGDPVSWPASGVFAQLSGLPITVAGVPSARFLTQRCFNPVSVSLKQLAISVFDYISSLSINGVGLGFYPSDLGADQIFVARQVKQAGFSIDQNGDLLAEASLENNINTFGGLDVGDANCGAIIDDPLSNPYPLGALAPALDSPSFCPDPSASSQFSVPMLTQFVFNAARLPCISARESIWLRAARSATSNFDQMISRAKDELLGSFQIPDRGGLINSARKVLIVISGDVPWSAGQPYPQGSAPAAVSAALSVLDPDPSVDDPDDLSLYYIIFNNDTFGTPIASFNMAPLEKQFSSFPKAKLIYGTDFSIVNDRLSAYLALIERRVVLSK